MYHCREPRVKQKLYAGRRYFIACQLQPSSKDHNYHNIDSIIIMSPKRPSPIPETPRHYLRQLHSASLHWKVLGKLGPRDPVVWGVTVRPQKVDSWAPGPNLPRTHWNWFLLMILMQPTRGTVQQVGFWCRQVQDFWHGRPWYHQSRSTMWSRSSMKV